jgi:excisionase family DNA binding protein
MAPTENVRMFTAKQAAAYLGICAESVRRAYRRGDLPGIKDGLAIGGPVRYTKSDLDAYRALRVR